MRLARHRHDLLALSAVALLAACGGEPPLAPGGDNIAPTIAPLADRTVTINTLAAPTFTVDVVVTDPDDDELRVTVTSDDASVVAAQERMCAPGTCPVELTAMGDRATDVTVAVTARDAAGAEATATFQLRLSARLVTTAGDRGAGSLRRVVADAEPGDVVAFDTDGVFAAPQTIELLSQLVVSEDLSIDGPGADRVTVSGSGTTRVFRVEGGADVTLRAMTIVDGVAPLETIALGGATEQVRVGGAALVLEASRLTLEDVVVRDSDAPPGGGLLSLGGGLANIDAVLVMRGGSITSGHADLGGGVGALSTGAAGAATTLVDVVLEGNVADDAGGGVASLDGRLTVRGGRIDGNRGEHGAGITASGSLTIEAEAAFTGNIGTGRGGAIHVESGDATIADAELTGNSAAEGGGIWIGEATIAITESVLEGNVAGVGGGIMSYGVLRLTDSRLVANEATNATGERGGGGLASYGAATVEGGVISGNRSTSHGGGVWHRADTLSLRDVELADNVGLGRGGGIANSAHVDATGVSFLRNRAGTGAGYSGLSVSGTAVFRESTFMDNEASYAGTLDIQAGTAEIIDSDLVDNRATIGGAIHSHGDIQIRGSRMVGNAAGTGGAAYLRAGGTTVIDATTVRDNTASSEVPGGGDGHGGGLYLEDHSVALLNGSVLEGNRTDRDGGAIYALGQSGVMVRDSDVVDNAANQGGGIFAHADAGSAGVFIFDGSLVARNEAVRGPGDGLGGGIFVSAASGVIMDLRVGGSAIRDNEADGGGGVFAYGVSVWLEASTIANNRAIVGGGLLTLLADIEMTDATVIANRADQGGGGLYLEGGLLRFVGEGNLILGNFADADGNGSGTGGGIFGIGADLTDILRRDVFDNLPDDIVER